MFAPPCVQRLARQCNAPETVRKVASVILNTFMMAMLVYQQSSVAAYRMGGGLRSQNLRCLCAV